MSDQAFLEALEKRKRKERKITRGNGRNLKDMIRKVLTASRKVKEMENERPFATRH